jgi:hypothetical protein
MKRLAYFLMLLLVIDLVDDAWAVAPVAFDTPLAADNDYDDDYLAVQQQSGQELFPSHHEPAFLGRNPQTAELSFCRRGLPLGWDLTVPFAPPPLYVLMSLQI